MKEDEFNIELEKMYKTGIYTSWKWIKITFNGKNNDISFESNVGDWGINNNTSLVRMANEIKKTFFDLNKYFLDQLKREVKELQLYQRAYNEKKLIIHKGDFTLEELEVIVGSKK